MSTTASLCRCWKPKAKRALIALLIMTALPSMLSALEIKLASVAPENSPYGTALKQLAADWERISAGTVQIRIYPNGIAGNQSDMLRKMRIGQLQGGIFASTGLSTVTRGALAISVPFLIRSNSEFERAMRNLRPRLNRDVAKKGLTGVAWAQAGWLYLFSRMPVSTPEQAKALRLAVPPDEQELIAAFKALGYRPIPVDIPETLTALNSGLVDAFFSSPSVAAGYQWFGAAPYMLDLKIAPVLGTILINSSTWNRIPIDIRNQLEAAARKTESGLQTSIEQLDTQAIDIMKRYGLKIVSLSATEKAAWQKEFDTHKAAIIGPVFDRSAVELIEKSIARAGNP